VVHAATKTDAAKGVESSVRHRPALSGSRPARKKPRPARPARISYISLVDGNKDEREEGWDNKYGGSW
jgi:hypothetical protein